MIFTSVQPSIPTLGPYNFYDGFRGPFPGVNRSGCGVDRPPHLAPRLRMGGHMPLFPPCDFMACYRVLSCPRGVSLSLSRFGRVPEFTAWGFGDFSVSCQVKIRVVIPPDQVYLICFRYHTYIHTLFHSTLKSCSLYIITKLYTVGTERHQWSRAHRSIYLGTRWKRMV
jgi:hypothetical protein